MKAKLAGLTVFAALLTLLVWNAVEIAQNVRSLRPSGEGDDAPAIALRPVDPDGPKTLTELRGRVVLVDFWATWCGPCRRSMPAIERLYEAYHLKGLEVVSINVENDGAKAKAFAAAFKPQLTFPLYVDDGAAQNAYRVEGIPHLVLIDREGKVALVHVGGFDPKELDTRIAELTK